ncbi:MAG TPA: hypothetical protein V6C57_22320 [Coleofasciculaceae cyanobacterium]
MLSQSSKSPNRAMRPSRKNLWFERVMALIALLNLILVLFDLSYIPWRDLYLQQFPHFTAWYGSQFKGIEPHRSTEVYLQKVEELENQVANTGLQSPQADQRLAELRLLSIEMVDENPFEGANKSGTLERLKRRMRDRTGLSSSKQAFELFWSAKYLTQKGWLNEINFFKSRIAPLIATNYYRGIADNGEPIDRFWQIDLGFISLFAIELLARTFYLNRRYKGTTWLDTLVWRWYDLLLLLPFWRWLRIIPVTIRLNQARLINLDPLNNTVVHSVASTFAVELTEVVVLRMMDQAQELLRRGEIARWLVHPQGGKQYIDLTGVNEGEAIAKRLTTILVDQVLPHVKPEVDALMHHILTQVLNSSPIYAGLQRLPGASQMSQQITRQIVAEASQQSYQALKSGLEDEVGAQLVEQLVAQFGSVLQTEIQKNRAIEDIQVMAIALLEEIKFNYVRQIKQEDLEELKARTSQLYEITQINRR